MDIWKRIEEKGGAPLVAKLRELASDPELAPYIRIGAPGGAPIEATGEGQRACTELSAAFDGNRQPTIIPDTMRPIYAGVGTVMGHKSCFNAPDLPTRPKEEGLIEGTLALADTKRREPRKMALTEASPEELVLLCTMIAVNRQLFKTTSRFIRNLIGNLAILEDRAARLAKSDYDLIRAAAQRDETLNELLEDTEEYFYGSAKQGAQTAKDNKTRLQAVQAEAEAKGRKAGEKEARDLISDEAASLVQLIQSMSGTRALPR